MNTLKLLAVGAILAVGVAGVAKADTLGDVQKRGALNCGVNGPTGLTGFGIPDDQGHWRGLDVDVCRAVAAAIFGDATKVKYVPLGSKERFTALQSGEIDMLARNSTWTFSRENDLGLDFVAVNYYDGQGFMVRKELGVDSALKLVGRHHLRADRHDDREELRRLLPHQQDGAEVGRLRERRPGARRL